eukprot:CAMPEP_0170179402 /NCGR_PEP_ID=MMETSP0040_2-20121228/17508_1 /TAXON_ID=641309 /ORGANISM="Lotharella oceanica, Strain CCMP622" /LENGTH=184 /DNA_ID=CAMNT_0010423441 /DNA_START=62 /DNA_END=616 /DNA_ORIENTATION=+
MFSFTANSNPFESSGAKSSSSSQGSSEAWGLFGSPSLFSDAPSSSSSSPFGESKDKPSTTGGLFGETKDKPSPTTGGLFGDNSEWGSQENKGLSWSRSTNEQQDYNTTFSMDDPDFANAFGQEDKDHVCFDKDPTDEFVDLRSASTRQREQNAFSAFADSSIFGEPAKQRRTARKSSSLGWGLF